MEATATPGTLSRLELSSITSNISSRRRLSKQALRHLFFFENRFGATKKQKRNEKKKNRKKNQLRNCVLNGAQIPLAFCIVVIINCITLRHSFASPRGTSVAPRRRRPLLLLLLLWERPLPSPSQLIFNVFNVW